MAFVNNSITRTEITHVIVNNIELQVKAFTRSQFS